MEASVSGLLAGKRLLVTGVLTDQSIAFSVAKVAQEQGATVVLTGFGRLSLVERIAKRLPVEPPVIELDVTSTEHLATLPDKVREHVDGLGGAVTAPGAAAGGGPAPPADWCPATAGGVGRAGGGYHAVGGGGGAGGRGGGMGSAAFLLLWWGGRGGPTRDIARPPSSC